jgi:hypothetical protein
LSRARYQGFLLDCFGPSDSPPASRKVGSTTPPTRQLTMANLVVYELFPRSSLMIALTGREWTGSEHALSIGCAFSLASSFVKSGRSESPFAALSILSNDRNTHVWLSKLWVVSLDLQTSPRLYIGSCDLVYSRLVSCLIGL